MTTYPQSTTDWVGKGWHAEQPKTTMTVHGVQDFTVVACRDINNRVHLLTRWADGEVTISWNWRAELPIELYDGPIDPRFHAFVNSFLEYLDAAVEKEM